MSQSKLLLFLLSAYIIINLCIGVHCKTIYQNEISNTTLSIRHHVDSFIQQEMRKRAGAIISRSTMHISRGGSVSKKAPYSRNLKTSHGEKSVSIDSITDARNITTDIKLRFAQSISMIENPLDIDSLRKSCQESLKKKHIFTDLSFMLNHDNDYKISGDTLHSETILRYDIGCCNEYSLQANMHLPFFFSAKIKDNFKNIIFFEMACFLIGFICYINSRKRKSFSHTQPRRIENLPFLLEAKIAPTTTGDKMQGKNTTVSDESTPQIQYICSLSTFFIPNTNHSITLTELESHLFETLLSAPNHSIKTSELRNIIWKNIEFKTSALAMAKTRLAEKLRNVGDITITYNRTTKCYVLHIHVDLEVIDT